MKEKIKNDLITAQKEKAQLTLSVLRSVMAAISEIALRSGNINNPVSDVEIIACIRKQIKMREDAAEQFINGGRQELAEKEKNEIEILKIYLPAEMNDIDLGVIITQTIQELGATTKKDIGKVVGAVIGKVNGTADNSKIAKLTASLL